MDEDVLIDNATPREGRRPMVGVSRRRRRSGAIVTASALAFITVLASGCGSSGGADSAGSGGTSSVGSEPTSSAVGSSSATAGVEAAKKAVAAAQVTPTSIGQTTPLDTAPPNGKTVVFIQDEIPQSVVIGQGEKAAAAAAGWKFVLLNYKSEDTSSLITAMKQALQYHPVSVSFAGEPQAVWASEIPAYKAAGVAIIPTVIGPQDTGGPVKANISHFLDSGVALGNWFIADSNGQGDALLVDLPTFPILTEVITGIKQAIATNCPGCKTSAFNGTLSELGSQTFVSSVVSALRKNSQIHYVLSSDLLFLAGLRTALNAAGIHDVKIAGAQPTDADFTGVKNGTESAVTVVSNTLVGWIVADVSFRLAENMPVASDDGGMPFQLLTKSNISIGNTTQPADYQSRFLALWHLS